MPFTYIADTCKLEMQGIIRTTLQPVINVLHCRLTDANQTFPHVLAIATAAEASWTADIASWSNDYQFLGATCTGLATAIAPQAFAPAIAGTVGTGAPAPANACVLVDLFTALRGRRHRGRVFFSPTKASFQADASHWTGPGVADFVSVITDLQTVLGALTPASTLVVASKLDHASQDVNNVSGELEMASMRRRLTGR